MVPGTLGTAVRCKCWSYTPFTN